MFSQTISTNIQDVSFISLPGKRKYNEDRTVAIKGQDFEFFAIMDGHGGFNVSKFLQQQLRHIFEFKTLQQVAALTQSSLYNSLIKAMERKDMNIIQDIRQDKYALRQMLDDIFQSLQHQIVDKFSKISNAGSTLVSLLVTDNYIIASSIGDSVIYKFHSRFPNFDLMLQRDLIDDSSAKRIVKKGGFIDQGRVCGKLGMARAFGDLDVQQYLDFEIRHKIFDICKNKSIHFILASDGFSDVIEEDNLTMLKCAEIFKMLAHNKEEDYGSLTNVQKLQWLRQILDERADDNLSLMFVKVGKS